MGVSVRVSLELAWTGMCVSSEKCRFLHDIIYERLMGLMGWNGQGVQTGKNQQVLLSRWEQAEKCHPEPVAPRIEEIFKCLCRLD